MIKLASWLSALLLFLAGLTSSLAFAPYNQFWLVFLLFPLVIYCCFKTTLKQASVRAFSFSLGWFSSGLSWIFVSLDEHGGMPVIASVAIILALSAYLALYFTAAISLIHALQKYSRHAIYALPVSWVVFEWLRSFVLTGFPWLSVGYSQTNSPFSVFAPFIGEIGLTFSIILISVIIAKHHNCIVRMSLVVLFIASSTTLTTWFGKPESFVKSPQNLTNSIYATNATNVKNTAQQQAQATQHTTQYTTAQKTKPNSVNLTLVQGNILQENRWDPELLWPVMQTYQNLSRPHYSTSDIIIWPEAAIPAVEPIAQEYLDNLDKATGFNQAALITGIINYQQYANQFFNSLIVLGNKTYQSGEGHYQYGHDNRYNKHHLLPIGEFVPFEQWLRDVAPLFDLPYSSFNRGEFIQADLIANGFHVMSAICYEILFPRQIKANLKPDTDFILTVSNDAWFGRSHGPHQHLEIAQMRALEFGIAVVRVTNTGITAIIDEHGKIKARAPQFEEHILKYQLNLNRYTTWYARFGEWPIRLFSLLLLILIFIPPLFRATKSNTIPTNKSEIENKTKNNS